MRNGNEPKRRPLLTAAQCFNYLEQERLAHWFSLREGHLTLAAQQSNFVQKMTHYHATARKAEAELNGET